jgi:hypothetical protein
MARKLSNWNIFVKKIYAEGKAKNPNYEFKQALEDASKRKSEMKNHSASGVKHAKSSKKSRKMGRSRRASMSASLAGGKSRKRHHRR